MLNPSDIENQCVFVIDSPTDLSSSYGSLLTRFSQNVMAVARWSNKGAGRSENCAPMNSDSLAVNPLLQDWTDPYGLPNVA